MPLPQIGDGEPVVSVVLPVSVPVLVLSLLVVEDASAPLVPSLPELASEPPVVPVVLVVSLGLSPEDEEHSVTPCSAMNASIISTVHPRFNDPAQATIDRALFMEILMSLSLLDAIQARTPVAPIW
jgi:hypothetical protein